MSHKARSGNNLTASTREVARLIVALRFAKLRMIGAI
jgi:hypothetical protein